MERWPHRFKQRPKQRQDTGRFREVKGVPIGWRRRFSASCPPNVAPDYLHVFITQILNPAQQRHCQEAGREYQPLYFFVAGPCSHQAPRDPQNLEEV